MPSTVNSDYQAFQFVTNSQRRLELWGTLLSFQHEIQTGVVEHLILKREGAIHQRPVVPPRKFVYKCTLIGRDVGPRYRALADAISEDPTGQLIDPRFGSLRAVCENLQAAEDPAEGPVDEVIFTIRFAESGLRTSPRESAGSIAAGAMARAESFAAGVPASFSTYAAALRTAVNSLVSQIAAAVTLPQVIEAHRALDRVTQQTDAIQRAAKAQGLYDTGAQAALIRSAAQQAVDQLDAQRPRSKRHYVEADISLARLCAGLYGGRWARQMAAEILAANTIRNPLQIPAGTWLTITDPEALRQNGAA